MRQAHDDVPPRATFEDPPLEGATVSIRLFVSLKRAQSCETASAARSLQRIVRLAVWRAPSTFGGSAASMRRQVLALTMTQQRDSFSSFAIDSVIRPSVVSLRDFGRSWGCGNEF